MTEEIIKNLESRIDHLEKKMDSNEFLVAEYLHNIYGTLVLNGLTNQFLMLGLQIHSNSIKILQSITNAMASFDKDEVYKLYKEIDVYSETEDAIRNEYNKKKEKLIIDLLDFYKRILKNPDFDNEFKNSVKSLYLQLTEEKNKQQID